MIPEHFRQNIGLDINIFGFDVKVEYKYWWPREKPEPASSPLVCHAEFRSDSPVISHTGYKSHFFYAELLKFSNHNSLEEFLVELGEHLARENGYEPPSKGNQLSLF